MLDLAEQLFQCFVNEEYSDPQARQFLWAIYEGIRRVDPMGNRFSGHTARKKHKCTRGCVIREGDEYFHAHNGIAWGSEIKLCARCMSMILYYADVQSLKPFMYTHWDNDKQQPV
jgi:hypothetical protein